MSDQTGRNRPREAGTFNRRPVRYILFTLRHLAERVQWYQQRGRRTRARWKIVFFSAHLVFSCRVYECRGERYAPNCVPQVDRFGGGRVVVWTGIHHGGRTAVHETGALTGMRYRDEILQHRVIMDKKLKGGVSHHEETT